MMGPLTSAVCTVSGLCPNETASADPQPVTIYSESLHRAENFTAGPRWEKAASLSSSAEFRELSAQTDFVLCVLRADWMIALGPQCPSSQ